MALHLTESALRRVRTILEQHGEAAGLRLGVREAGCSGLSYVVELAEQVAPDDQLFSDQGVPVVINREHLPYLEGIELDYRKEGLNEAFRFNNPHAKETCGCGESFTV